MEDLEVAFGNLQTWFHQFDRVLKQLDRQMWEKWKAGGKAVTSEFLSMYPSAEECFDRLQEEAQEEPEEDCDVD
jgi:hypothetical protein